MIRYSIETLYHFACDHCNKWWSIGDHQMPSKTEELTCPYCKTTGEVVPIKDGPQDPIWEDLK